MDDVKQNDEAKAANDSRDYGAELEKLKSERDEYLNGWKRAKADLINYQKDEAARIEEFAKFGQETVLREIISVADNLNLALAAAEKSDGKVDGGLEIVRNQLMEIMRKRGVVRIEVKPGEDYNPKYHEAIEMVQSRGGLNSGAVAEVLEPGYMLHDYVLKPAKVKVVT